jgi:DNA-binding NarL/FixJ family response regulator
MTLSAFLVEDSKVIRDNLIPALADLADVHVISTTASEGEAQIWLRGHTGKWDLGIVDLFLEHGSGLGVLALCRDRGALQRVVILTNYATSETRYRCLGLGADAVFDKSTELEAFLAFCLSDEPRHPSSF